MNVDGAVFELQDGQEPIRRFTAPAGIMGRFSVSIGDVFWQTGMAGTVLRLSPSGEVVKEYGAKFGDWAERAFTVDRDQKVWLEGDYVYSLDGTRLSDVQLPPGRQVDLDSRGRIVVVGEKAVTWLDADVRTLREVGVGHNLGSCVVDGQDRVWAVERYHPGVATSIHRVSIDGQVQTFNPTNSAITGLQLAHEGGFWLADRDASILYKMDDAGHVTGAQRLEDGYMAFAADPKGPLWVGYFHFSGGKVDPSAGSAEERGYFGEAVKYVIK